MLGGDKYYGKNKWNRTRKLRRAGRKVGPNLNRVVRVGCTEVTRSKYLEEAREEPRGQRKEPVQRPWVGADLACSHHEQGSPCGLSGESKRERQVGVSSGDTGRSTQMTEGPQAMEGLTPTDAVRSFRRSEQRMDTT